MTQPDADAPREQPGGFPVPFPRKTVITEVVTKDTVLDDEQLARVGSWLKANGVDPALVTRSEITIREPRGARPVICFTQYVLDGDGQKHMDPLTHEVAVFRRSVSMMVPLPPQPETDAAGHNFRHPAFVNPVRCSHCGTEETASAALNRCAGSPQAAQPQQTGQEVRS